MPRTPDCGNGARRRLPLSCGAGVVAGVAVEAVLERGGGIAQLAFAHDCALLEIQVAEGLVANLVGDLQPDAPVVLRLALTE